MLLSHGLCTYTGGMARPATGKTPLRNIRVPDALWKAAKAKAAAEGRTLTDVLVAYLHRYVNAPRRGTDEQRGADTDSDEETKP